MWMRDDVCAPFFWRNQQTHAHMFPYMQRQRGEMMMNRLEWMVENRSLCEKYLRMVHSIVHPSPNSRCRQQREQSLLSCRLVRHLSIDVLVPVASENPFNRW